MIVVECHPHYLTAPRPSPGTSEANDRTTFRYHSRVNKSAQRASNRQAPEEGVTPTAAPEQDRQATHIRGDDAETIAQQREDQHGGVQARRSAAMYEEQERFVKEELFM